VILASRMGTLRLYSHNDVGDKSRQFAGFQRDIGCWRWRDGGLALSVRMRRRFESPHPCGHALPVENAKAPTSSRPERFSEVGLAPVLREVGDLYEPIAEDKHVALAVEAAAARLHSRTITVAETADKRDALVPLAPATRHPNSPIGIRPPTKSHHQQRKTARAACVIDDRAGERLIPSWKL
jgi:hypothetical protein